MKTIVVLISVKNFPGGRATSEEIENLEFDSTKEIMSEILKIERRKKIIDEEDIVMYSLTDFVSACNDQFINLENYWISYVTLK